MLLWIARDDVRQRTHGAGHSGLRPSHAWRLSYITGLHRAVHPLVHVLCHHAVIAHLSSRGLHSHFRVHVGANGVSLRHLMAIVSHATLLEVFLLYLPIVARHERLSALCRWAARCKTFDRCISVCGHKYWSTSPHPALSIFITSKSLYRFRKIKGHCTDRHCHLCTGLHHLQPAHRHGLRRSAEPSARTSPACFLRIACISDGFYLTLQKTPSDDTFHTLPTNQ